MAKTKRRRKGPTRQQSEDMRKLWSPKLREVQERCVSCPFKIGNDKEFGAILQKLSAANNGQQITKAVVQRARLEVMLDLQHGGDFVCHLSIYESDIDGQRPQSEWRQCKGASEFYRNVRTVGDCS